MRTLRARVALAVLGILVLVLLVAGTLVYTLVGGFLQSRADSTLVAIRTSVASVVTNGVPPGRRGQDAFGGGGFPTAAPTGVRPSGAPVFPGGQDGFAGSAPPTADPTPSSTQTSGSGDATGDGIGTDGQLTATALSDIAQQVPTGGFIAVGQTGDLQLVGSSDVTSAEVSSQTGSTGLHTVTIGGRDYRLAATSAQGQTVLVASPVSDVQDTRNRLLVTMLIVGAVALPVAGLFTALAVRRGLRPLAAVVSTADGIAAGDLDRRVPDERAPAEVASVAHALNRMLDANQTAFAERDATTDRLRRFVADASHELRTPLASVRGYAELLGRPGALGPDDAAMALGRVQAEAIRMTSLVEDLLLLARLDAGRPLRQDVVDLVPLLQDSVRDHRTLAGESYPVVVDLPAAARVVGDADRLRQVATNLLANVRAHTPAGTTVTVSVVTSGADVVWTTQDDGPGVPEADRERVFERFSRVDSSRHRREQNQGAGGSGLGLSIVDAIVHSSKGSVALLPPPGFGVRVTMTAAP